MEVPKIFKNKTHYILQVYTYVCIKTELRDLYIAMPLQYAIVLSPESIRQVHHILVYLCEGMNLTGHPDVGVRQECDNIAEEVQPCRFSTLIAGWAIGGNVHKQPLNYAYGCVMIFFNWLMKLQMYITLLFFHTEFYISRRGCITYWWKR